MLNIAVVFAEPGLPAHPKGGKKNPSSLVPRGTQFPLAPPHGRHWAFT